MPSPYATTEPFVEHTHTRVIHADREHAVVEQAGVEDLNNHVGVRHASALHAAGYEASRALMVAALDDLAPSAQLQLARTEIAYTAVGLGPLTTTARPDGSAWEHLSADVEAGVEATLETLVTTTGEDGKTVAELTVCWTVTPAR
jgi:Domain of unknown function (DUF4442)